MSCLAAEYLDHEVPSPPRAAPRSHHSYSLLSSVAAATRHPLSLQHTSPVGGSMGPPWGPAAAAAAMAGGDFSRGGHGALGAVLHHLQHDAWQVQQQQRDGAQQQLQQQQREGAQQQLQQQQGQRDGVFKVPALPMTGGHKRSRAHEPHPAAAADAVQAAQAAARTAHAAAAAAGPSLEHQGVSDGADDSIGMPQLHPHLQVAAEEGNAAVQQSPGSKRQRLEQQQGPPDPATAASGVTVGGVLGAAAAATTEPGSAGNTPAATGCGGKDGVTQLAGVPAAATASAAAASPDVVDHGTRADQQPISSSHASLVLSAAAAAAVGGDGSSAGVQGAGSSGVKKKKLTCRKSTGGTMPKMQLAAPSGAGRAGAAVAAAAAAADGLAGIAGLVQANAEPSTQQQHAGGNRKRRVELPPLSLPVGSPTGSCQECSWPHSSPSTGAVSGSPGRPPKARRTQSTAVTPAGGAAAGGAAGVAAATGAVTGAAAAGGATPLGAAHESAANPQSPASTLARMAFPPAGSGMAGKEAAAAAAAAAGSGGCGAEHATTNKELRGQHTPTAAVAAAAVFTVPGRWAATEQLQPSPTSAGRVSKRGSAAAAAGTAAAGKASGQQRGSSVSPRTAAAIKAAAESPFRRTTRSSGSRSRRKGGSSSQCDTGAAAAAAGPPAAAAAAAAAGGGNGVPLEPLVVALASGKDGILWLEYGRGHHAIASHRQECGT